MKKLFYCLLILLMGFGSTDLSGQNVVYRDTFKNGVPPTTAQINRWSAFCAKLTSTLNYTGMTIRGSYDLTGKKCTDATITKDFATALRTYSTYISSTTGGNVWSTCARYLGEVWINPPSSCNGSNCPSPGYIIRPGIGTSNSNWGGINTATCGGPDQWMELIFEVTPPYNYNIATKGVNKPDVCVVKQDIVANFSNLGKKALDSFQYTVKINSTVYGPYWKKTTLASQGSIQFTVLSGYTFTPNTSYTISVWANKPNNFKDSFSSDDTFTTSITFNGSKGTPNAIDTTVCGSQIVIARAIPASPGDSVAWYSDRLLGGQIGTGYKYTSKYLASGVTYKFYAASYNGFVKATLNTGYTYAYSYTGTMFNLTATSGDLLIDSFGVNLYSNGAPVGQNTPLEIYMRKGGYNGYEQNSGAWTKVWTGNVLSKGNQQRSLIYFKTTLQSGVTYGVYMNFTGGATQIPLLSGTGITHTTPDLQLQGGTMNAANFGSVVQSGTYEGEVFYRKVLCKSAPDSATIVVNPSPYGAKLVAGIPFQTSPKKSGTGVKGSPHVVAMGDTIALNLSAPTGYVNGGHNSKWKVSSVAMFSPSGRALTSFTWTDPNPNDGRLVYTPDNSVIDSIVTAVVKIRQIGGSGCDTVLTHYIYVAPLPVPSFTRASKICDGDVIDFTNTSTIQSGFLEYKWYFGDGDSSEATEPVKQYPAYGTYYCKLNAISSIYGYSRTKIDTIVITQIPSINFKVTNACETKTHVFTNNTTVNAGTLQYSWDFGDNTAKNFTKSPTHTYSTAGQYKVTLTATANGCSSTASKNAYLFPKPVAAYTFPAAKYCTNTPVNFTNKSTISSGNIGVMWSFDGGDIGTVNSPTYVFENPGTFTVKMLSISEFGCIDSAKKAITIFEAPKVSFTTSPLCDQTPTDFTNTTPVISGTQNNPQWYFGDGGTSTANNPSHQYTRVGPTTVKFVMSTLAGCADSITKQLNVGTQANVNFDAQSACSGQEVQFENKTSFTQGNVAYEWNFGGAGTSTVSDPKFTFNVTGTKTFNITLKATVDGSCESSLTKPLNILELPNCAFTISDDWSGGEGYRTIKVTAADQTYPYYRFKFSDGGSLLTSNGIYQFPYEGDFTVTMIARNAVDCECVAQQSKSIRNSMGTASIVNGDINLYPNPSTGVVNISATAGTKINSVEVYTLLGDQVQVVSKINETSGSIEFGDVTNGIYLVKVTTNNGTLTRRITINK